MPTGPEKPRLLVISYRYPPETYPLAIGLRGVIDHLREDWDIDVVTAAEDAYEPKGVQIERVLPRSLNWFQRQMGNLRLDKIARFLLFPDPFWPWVFPALKRCTHLHQEHPYEAALVFMMPFSTGFVGTQLKNKLGLPLILNFNDSPTCSDMNPWFPSRLHYQFTRWMEDYFIRTADRVVYVSSQNRDRVQTRQSSDQRGKIRLVRCSVLSNFASHSSEPVTRDTFQIVYTGAMSGWYALDPSPTSPLQHLYRAWNALGTYQLAPVDPRSHSPVYVGRAVRRVLDQHPEWANRLQIEIYGNTYPDDVIDRVLRRYDLQDIVRVHGRIPHRAVHETIRRAHLLFLTLPDRLDGSAGGRISLKTYEYLTTNRPILAALPRGENRTVLGSKTGTYLAKPKDVEKMANHISILAGKHFAGENISTDRSVLQTSLSSRRRAQQLHTILSEATGRPASSRWSIPEQV